jgi:UDP-glucose 6-dehydrogenase
VTEKRGFAGPCIPKDMNALVAAAKPLLPVPLLEAIVSYNQSIREANSQSHTSD